jgi:hypothetical protein
MGGNQHTGVVQEAPVLIVFKGFTPISGEAGEDPVTSTNSYLTFDINALIVCDDSHFLGTLNRVFTRLGVRSERCHDYAAALAACGLSPDA